MRIRNIFISDEILSGADAEDVALLVVGDPFGATTHTDLVLRAKVRVFGYRLIVKVLIDGVID